MTPKEIAKTQRVKREISRKYNIGTKVLGMGKFGEVFLAENKNDPT
jgi:hypothetical protein